MSPLGPNTSVLEASRLFELVGGESLLEGPLRGSGRGGLVVSHTRSLFFTGSKCEAPERHLGRLGRVEPLQPDLWRRHQLPGASLLLPEVGREGLEPGSSFKRGQVRNVWLLGGSLTSGPLCGRFIVGDRGIPENKYFPCTHLRFQLSLD